MKALVHRGSRNFPIESRPEPKAGPGQLLLRPAYVGVCFSDKHRYDGTSYSSGWRDGLIIGHEFSAVVEAVGDGVDGWMRGDAVSVDPRHSCGECDSCHAGLGTFCGVDLSFMGVGNGPDGGFADLCVAPANDCYRIPEGVSLLAASMAEPMACTTRAIRLSGFAAQDDAIIFGAEDYGLTMTNWLRLSGARHVLVVDPDAGRRQAALELGATAAIDPSTENVVEAARRYLPRGADYSFVAAEDYIRQSDHYLQQAFDCTRPQGSVVMLRIYSPKPYANLNPMTPFLKEITLKQFGVFWGTEPSRGGRARGDWQMTLEAMNRGLTSPLPGTNLIDFEDLKSEKDVADMYGGLPHSCSKAIVKIAGG